MGNEPRCWRCDYGVHDSFYDGDSDVAVVCCVYPTRAVDYDDYDTPMEDPHARVIGPHDLYYWEPGRNKTGRPGDCPLLAKGTDDANTLDTE